MKGLTAEQMQEMTKAITLGLPVPYDDPEVEAQLRKEIQAIIDAGQEVALE